MLAGRLRTALVVISPDARCFSPSCLRCPTLDRPRPATKISSISTTKSGASLAKNPHRLQSALHSALSQENTAFPTLSVRSRIRLLPPHLQQEALLLAFPVRAPSLLTCYLTATLSEKPSYPPEIRPNIESTLSPVSQKRHRPLPNPPGAILSPVTSPTDPHLVDVPQAVLNTSRPGTANVDRYATSESLYYLLTCLESSPITSNPWFYWWSWLVGLRSLPNFCEINHDSAIR